MKAVLVREFGSLEDIGFEEMPDPQAGPGEVVIDVVAAETNYPDLLVIEGKYQVKPPLPFSPGKAAAGRIAATGQGVSGLAIGDAVVAHVEYGAYAEKLRARAESCVRMPAGMPFDKAAALGLAYQTAWFALQERGGLARGESVLVLGASGAVGVAAIQLAKAFGAGVVIAGVRGDGNTLLVRRLGADHVVDLADANLRESLREKVRAVTAGRGVDIVIDPVGGDANAAALRAMAWCGRLIVIGFASKQIPRIEANYLLVKNIAVSGLHWSDYRDRAPERVAQAQRQIFDLHTRGTLDPHIHRKVRLDDFRTALAMIRDGGTQGKIILTASA